MIFSVVYLPARRLLEGLMVMARREVSKDAELLARERGPGRHTGPVRYQPPDRLWLAALPRPIPADGETMFSR